MSVTLDLYIFEFLGNTKFSEYVTLNLCSLVIVSFLNM